MQRVAAAYTGLQIRDVLFRLGESCRIDGFRLVSGIAPPGDVPGWNSLQNELAEPMRVAFRRHESALVHDARGRLIRRTLRNIRGKAAGSVIRKRIGNAPDKLWRRGAGP